MELRITYGGGMRDYRSETVIRMQNSFTKVVDEGKETVQALPFTVSALDSLAAVLHTQVFDRVRSQRRNGIVYDMGTTTIQLVWPGGQTSVSVGASQEIAGGDQKQYQAVNEAIRKLLNNAGLE